jgi:hypothetical protein
MKSVKRLTTAAVLGLSFQLVLLLALAPSTNAATPYCTVTTSPPSSTLYYTVTVAGCSTSGVALGSSVTATATTNDPSITAVWFNFYSPSTPTVATYSSGPVTPFTYGPISLSAPGNWVVTAYFEQGLGTTAYIVSLDISVQILVLNELPLGTLAASSVALIGFFAVRRLAKNFSATIPTK